MTPVVGVTTWRRPLDTVVAAAQPLYTLGVDYVERLGAAGLVVLLLPVLDDDGVAAVVGRIDGLVLSGGQDVDPSMYGQQPAGSVDVDREVDESEVRLARAARDRRLPLLGICRGLQVLNVALGGTLHQEVTGRTCAHPTRSADRTAALAHRHVVALDGRLAEIYGHHRREVTSLHHQATDRLAEPLRIAAQADDGVIEGVESGDDGWWAVGVQWHPEKVGAHEQPLFDAFAAAVLASAAGSLLSQPPKESPRRMRMDEYRAANHASWQERAPLHAASPDYRIQRLIAEPDLLSPVVEADRERLGDLSGLDAVHLQCHIGTDTVSLARLGARVVGVDFSEASLEVARQLAVDTGADATFVPSDLYEAVTALDGRRFDLVYTGTGALNWLPDIRGWAQVVASLLRPGGRLLLREGHPVVWALDDERDDRLLVLTYPYFETVQPQRWESEQTYVAVEGELSSTVTYEWNHGLGEIVQAVIDAGLVVTELAEHTELHWPFFSWMESLGDGRFALPEGRERLPLSYTLQARAT